MFDEDGAPALDHPAHTAIESRDLHDALDHLDGAALLVDDHGEGGSLYDGGKHRSVDREMRDSRVLHLKQQSSEILDHSGEAARLRSRG